ncbi:hypothetical protein GBF38_010348, partial [Nibea albiflora]
MGREGGREEEREGREFTYVYGDLPRRRELSMLQCDEDVEMWDGIWEASVLEPPVPAWAYQADKNLCLLPRELRELSGPEVSGEYRGCLSELISPLPSRTQPKPRPAR